MPQFRERERISFVKKIPKTVLSIYQSLCVCKEPITHASFLLPEEKRKGYKLQGKTQSHFQYLDKDMSCTSKCIMRKIHTSTGFHAQNISYPVLRIIGTCYQASFIELNYLVHNKSTSQIIKYNNSPIQEKQTIKTTKEIRIRNTPLLEKRGPSYTKGGTLLA